MAESQETSALTHDGQETDSNYLPYGFIRKHGVVITNVSDGVAHVLYKPGCKVTVFSEIKRYLGCALKLHKVSSEEFETRVAELYEAGSSQAMQVMDDISEDMDLNHVAMGLGETEDLLDTQDDAPIIRLINALLTESLKEEASDIHIETYEHNMVVRFRVDGVLREVLQPPRAVAPLLVSRIKVMAHLDIAEKRVPQDGRISLKINNRAVDVRVSTLPSNHGERVVLRLLDKQAGRLTLKNLGMATQATIDLTNLIHKPHGIILVTGPTGSGKTTTLYAALSKLNNRTRNIVTVEDPIEYNLEGVGQTQVNRKVNMTFARGLRAILRQDPDVVMVGEIRDLETAQIAVQASLTGHMVLSTLHTNSAIGAIARLRDMGVEPFLLASSMVGILAQRLVRKLCPHCKEETIPNEKDCELLGISNKENPVIYRPRKDGCEHCLHLGYHGRTGIYEFIEIDDELRSLIHDGANEITLIKHARLKSPGIRHDGLRRILHGDTSIEEVLRVTQEN
ncbi:MAG TPA: type II secretion system protein GspE [Gammaproteobacteria bacterium]|nr:type II secretion system protein GspE [Gammaproteobacteria bacterium]